MQHNNSFFGKFKLLINKTGKIVLKRLRRQKKKPRLEKIDKDWNKGQGKIEKDCKRFEKIGKD